VDDDVRDALLEYAAHGHEILVLLHDGRRVIGHVEGLGGGRVTIIERLPEGRVRRQVSFDEIHSVGSFDEARDVDEDEEPGEVPQDIADLMAMSQRLAAQARQGNAVIRPGGLVD
jgi:hypothetical protein